VNLIRYTFLLWSVCSSNIGSADTVVTSNGSSLVGRIHSITSESVKMDTDYAGTITIDVAQITSLTTESPISTRLEDGTVVSGITVITDDRLVIITDDVTSWQTSTDNLIASWLPGEAPPKVAGYSSPRYWRHRIGADISGRRGNSNENGTSIHAETALVSDHNELKLYLSMERAESDDVDTSDEIIIGTTYVNYFSDYIGWYVNTEFERDAFENIDLRATLSGGLSYWLFKQSMHSLELQTGAGYRHESYNDDSKQGIPIFDVNLQHAWQANSWLKMTNNLSYSPSISDLKDFLLEQDSGLIMPIGNTNWNLRLGFRNNYKNLPITGVKRLDTIYYSRLMVNFN